MSSKKKNVLIYRLGSLGDTVMALPCFHRIRESYPDAHITLLTNKPVMLKAAPLQAILGDQYFVDDILSYPVGTRNPVLLAKLSVQIRKKAIDTVINMTATRSRNADRRDKLFFKSAGIQNFIGFNGVRGKYTPDVDSQTGAIEWEASRLRARIQELGYFSLDDDRYWDLKITESEQAEADCLLMDIKNPHGIIAVNMGTKMPIKDWGAKNWNELIAALNSRFPRKALVLVGAKDEYDRNEECAQFWKGEVLNLCGKCSPRVSGAVLQYCDILIGHDSGAMHLSGCMGTPCVGIFSCINKPRQWHPRGQNNTILRPDTACAKNGKYACDRSEGFCVELISPEDVENAVLKTLSKTEAV